MRYELIIFDIDETLLDFLKTERLALKNTLLSYDIEYREEYHLKIYKDINTLVWKDLENGNIDQKELNHIRFSRFIDKLDLKLNPDKFASRYMDFASKEAHLYNGALDLVRQLSKSYNMAIITNGLSLIQKNRVKISGLDKYFDKIVISEELGISKPDKRIFNHTLDYFNIEDKKKAIIIGDSLSSDIQGGINAGIDTCWYNPNNLDNNSHIKPDYIVNNYKDIEEILL